MTPTPLRRLVDNWDAKHSILHNTYRREYCDLCDLINQLQRLLKEAGE